jgi:hypothetical protein
VNGKRFPVSRGEAQAAGKDMDDQFDQGRELSLIQRILALVVID